MKIGMKKFEISYNEIYMKDSRYLNKKNLTDYKYIIEEKPLNIKTKTETREEKIKDGYIFKQCYRIFYKINLERKEEFEKEEKEGKIQEE